MKLSIIIELLPVYLKQHSVFHIHIDSSTQNTLMHAHYWLEARSTIPYIFTSDNYYALLFTLHVRNRFLNWIKGSSATQSHFSSSTAYHNLQHLFFAYWMLIFSIIWESLEQIRMQLTLRATYSLHVWDWQCAVDWKFFYTSIRLLIIPNASGAS